MDVLIEFLLELVLDGAIEGSQSKRIPKALRLILLAIPFLLVIGLFVLIMYEGILWLNVLLGALIIAAVIGYVVLAYRILREIPRKKRNEQTGNENPDDE